MIQYFTDKRGKHRFRILGANGKIIASSQGYSSFSNAKRGFSDLCDAIVEGAE